MSSADVPGTVLKCGYGFLGLKELCSRNLTCSSIGEGVGVFSSLRDILKGNHRTGLRAAYCRANIDLDGSRLQSHLMHVAWTRLNRVPINPPSTKTSQRFHQIDQNFFYDSTNLVHIVYKLESFRNVCWENSRISFHFRYSFCERYVKSWVEVREPMSLP